MRLLITAGPTREFLDDVRFISNASSGRMGYAIAKAAAKAGHSVDMVSGPVTLPKPSGVRLVRVVSTQEMYRATAKLFPKADCLVGAAAPADWRPIRRRRGKMKKTQDAHAVELKTTVDILATLGRRKRKQVILAFALEVKDPIANALAKLQRKDADAIVLNSPSALGADKSSINVLFDSGDSIEMRKTSKERIAKLLVSLAETLYARACAGETD